MFESNKHTCVDSFGWKCRQFCTLEIFAFPPLLLTNSFSADTFVMVYVWYKYSLIIGITWPLRHRGVAHVAWRAKIFTTVDIHAILCHNEKDLNGELYQCEEGKDDNRLSVLYDLHRALGILVSAFYWGSEHQIPWFHSCVDKEWSVSERAFVSKCWQQI